MLSTPDLQRHNVWRGVREIMTLMKCCSLIRSLSLIINFFFNGIEVNTSWLNSWPKTQFSAHFNKKSKKAWRGIDLIKYVKSDLPTASLDHIYKMRVRPHLDYCDFIFHIPPLPNINSNESTLTVKWILWKVFNIRQLLE